MRARALRLFDNLIKIKMLSIKEHVINFMNNLFVKHFFHTFFKDAGFMIKLRQRKEPQLQITQVVSNSYFLLGLCRASKSS